MRTSLLPLGNIDMAKDYIIDYGNNYRKWKSGFIEQWGISSGNPDNISLLINFSNINYIVLALPTTGSSNTSDCYVTNKTVSGFTLTQYAKKSEGHNWYAFGY